LLFLFGLRSLCAIVLFCMIIAQTLTKFMHFYSVKLSLFVTLDCFRKTGCASGESLKLTLRLFFSCRPFMNGEVNRTVSALKYCWNRDGKLHVLIADQSKTSHEI
jgi:hypothetical protein